MPRGGLDPCQLRPDGPAPGAARMLMHPSGTPMNVPLHHALNLRHGTVHTDSLSKVVTALLYFNERWDAGSAGALRFLARKDDLDALLVPELPPVYGNLAAFRRSDNSWHGHLPYEGER